MRRGVILLLAWVSSTLATYSAGLTALAPIRIGVSNVQSGPSKSLGQQLTLGSTEYFRLVNNAGGIYGRSVALVLKDDKYEPDPAVENTNDLVTKQQVLFLFDYVGTPTLTRVLPLLAYYEQEKIVNVAPFTGADPQRTPPYNRYVFNIRASYREETRTLVDYLYEKGFRRIGFLGQADAYGKSGELGVEDALEAHDLKIAGIVTYRRNGSFSANMDAQVQFLRAKGADAVIAVGVYGPCGAFIRAARLSGWMVPIANVSFVNAQAMLDELRKASREAKTDLTVNLINSEVVPSPAAASYPLVRSYLAHVPAAAVGWTSLEGWLNAAVVTEALRRAGRNPTRDDFIRAMESLDGWDPGIGYKLNFSRTSHQGLHKVWLTKTQRSEWTQIELGSP